MKKSMVLAATLMLSASMSLFAADGAATYKAKCAGCHGADGSKAIPAMGVTPINSADVKKKSDKDIEDIVTKGKGKMKPIAGLSEEDAKAVAAYVKSLK